jgi:hypothetical protein
MNFVQIALIVFGVIAALVVLTVGLAIAFRRVVPPK